MELAQVTQNVKDTLQENLNGVNKNWIRGLAAGSLITGAVLLARGNRKAGFAVTAMGAAVALMEEAGNLREVWDQLPDYLQNGQKMLGKAEEFIKELSDQAERISRLMAQFSA